MNNQTPNTSSRKKWLSNLFYNNNVVAAAALIISVICWILLTLNVTESTTKTFSDIPIMIDTESLEESIGLHMITVLDPSDFLDKKADVTVSGSIYQLSKVEAENITITAQISNVTKPGEYILTLMPTCSVRNVNVKIENDYNFIKVWFDRYQEKNITIDKAVASGVTTPSEDLLIGDTYSSIKSLSIRAPESVIELISSVQVRADVNREIAATEQVSGTICYIGADGQMLPESVTGYIEILDYNDIGADGGTLAGAPSSADINITVPILKTVELPLRVTLKNAPDGFDASSLKYSISPGKVNLEGEATAIDKLAETGYYSVAEIDMAALTPGNCSFNLKLNLSTGIEELSGVTDVAVKFDLSGYTTKKMTLKNNGSFTLTDCDGINASIQSDSVDIIVAGPQAVIDKLSGADCIVTVSMEGYDGTPGQRKTEIQVSFKNVKNCWVVGSYTVMVSTS